jgi:hypothetical protein
MKNLVITLSLIGSLNAFAQQSIDVWKGLESGPYGIGFKTFETFDNTRPALKEQTSDTKQNGRVMQVSIWYPSDKSSNSTMTVGNYLALKGNEINFSSDKNAVKNAALKTLSSDFGASAEAIEKSLFDLTMKAEFSSDVVTQKFPIVLLTHNNAAGYALLGELLASHGFIVATSPMTGTSSKEFDWQTTSGIETEVKDMEFAFETVLKNFANADPSNVATLGHSYGAMAAVAYQTRHENVKAVVSLDGGIGSLWGGHLLSTLKDYHLSKINKPILHLWSDLEIGFDLHYVKSYKHADRYIIKAGGLAHGSFVADEMLAAILQNKSDKENKIKDHHHICRATLKFLAQTLQDKKNDWSEFAAKEILERCKNC